MKTLSKSKNFIDHVTSPSTAYGVLWKAPHAREGMALIGAAFRVYMATRNSPPRPQELLYVLAKEQVLETPGGQMASSFLEKASESEDSFLACLQYGESFYLMDTFTKDGRNMFDFSPRLLEMLVATDLDASVIPKDLVPPYDFFYMHMNGFTTMRGEVTGYTYTVEGAFIEVSRHAQSGEIETWAINLVTKVKDGERENYYVMLQFLPHSVHDSIKAALESLSSTPPRHRSDPGVMAAILTLIFNCLLYLSHLDRDVKYRYPDTMPAKMREAIQYGKKKQREKALKAATSLGYSKVHYCGYALQHEYEAQGGKRGELTEAHWRRGHWRNQPHGPGNGLRKLIWLRPVVVKREKGEPQRGRVYEVDIKEGV